MALLEVENLEVNYGMIKALKGISFSVEKGEIIALIGSNGAGNNDPSYNFRNTSGCFRQNNI